MSALLLTTRGVRGGDLPISLSPLPALSSATETRPDPGAGPASGAAEDQPFFVLCYHRFVHHPDGHEKLETAEYQMPVDEFKWQMQYLKDNGYQPISDQQLMDYWFQGKPLPLKPVLITFDDGFRTVYRDAFPVVKSFGYPSILFLYTQFIEYGEAALRRQIESQKKPKVKLGTEALKDDDILAMEKDGMVVESHTTHHLNLALEGEKRDRAAYERLLQAEYGNPLAFIEGKFGHRPQMLAYPYGVYNPAILKAVRAAGYKLAFTVNPGPNDRTVDPLKLKRNLVLYPISHGHFTDIFKDRVLHLKGLVPGDGDVIDTTRPLIQAEIRDPVVPRSVRLQLGNRVLAVRFNPRTGGFRHQVTEPLAQGGHILTLKARDVKGVDRVYNWYFRIKHTGLEKQKEADKKE